MNFDYKLDPPGTASWDRLYETYEDMNDIRLAREFFDRAPQKLIDEIRNKMCFTLADEDYWK